MTACNVADVDHFQVFDIAMLDLWVAFLPLALAALNGNYYYTAADTWLPQRCLQAAKMNTIHRP